MIALPLHQLLLAWTAVHLLAIGIAWSFYALRSRVRAGAFKRSIFHCGGCGYIYLDDRDRPMAPCPRCQTQNDRISH